MNIVPMGLLAAACAFGVFITPDEEMYMKLMYLIGLVYSSYSAGSSVQIITLQKNLEEVNLQMKEFYENQYKELARKLKDDDL